MTDIDANRNAAIKLMKKIYFNSYYPPKPAPYIFFDQDIADKITREGREHIENFFKQDKDDREN